MLPGRVELSLRSQWRLVLLDFADYSPAPRSTSRAPPERRMMTSTLQSLKGAVSWLILALGCSVPAEYAEVESTVVTDPADTGTEDVEAPESSPWTLRGRRVSMDSRISAHGGQLDALEQDPNSWRTLRDTYMKTISTSAWSTSSRCEALPWMSSTWKSSTADLTTWSRLRARGGRGATSDHESSCDGGPP